MTRTTLLLTLLASCCAVPTARSQPPPKADDALAALVVRSNNAFALDLYARLAAQAPADGNLFCSPHSVAGCLGLAYAGARGTTAEQMGKALQLNLAPPQLATGHAALRATLARRATEKDGGYQLNVASALFGKKGLGLRPEYVQQLQGGFGATAQEMDFAANPEKARQTMNAWGKEQTKGKFPEILPPGTVNAGSEVVLASAIYCKAAWTAPFNKKGTEIAPFQVTATRTVRAPLMRQNGTFAYLRGKDFRVIELPCNGGLSMIVLLPDRATPLADFEKTVTGDNLNDWLSRLKKQELQLFLPRFQVNHQVELRDTLADMGMPVAFSRDADFSGMTGRRNFHLSAVMHRAFVQVDEEGVEAAAATTAVVERGLTDPITFRADHPFIFLLRDTRTGLILFAGRLVNPQS